MSITLETKPRTGRQASHNNIVTSVAFAPDGQTLASGSWDGTIKVWDVQGSRLKIRRSLRGDWDEVEAVAFSPDGTAIAGLGTGFDRESFGVVTTWEPDSGRGRPLFRENGKLGAIAYSPDGKTLAMADGDGRAVILRDAESGQEQARLPDHRGPVWSVAFSPDGKLLAAASGKVPTMAEPAGDDQVGEVRLWSLTGRKPKLRANLPGHGYGIITVAFSPDGATLASGGYDRAVKLWSVTGGRELATLDGHEGWVASAAFSPDGKVLATGSHDQTIRLWDAKTGREITTLRGHSGNVYTVAFSPDGTLLASGSLDGTVRLWDMDQAIGREAVA